MKCIVIGAGNAGRPVARILNHQGHDVTITDSKNFDIFNEDAQSFLNIMETEGINIELNNDNPSIKEYDMIYLAPSIPKDSEIFKKANSYNMNILTNKDINDIVASYIDVDIIGITGTMGKTTTTFLTDSIFKSSGYKTWTCSSLVNNLVSEAIIDGIIKGENEKCDVAIFELPHGTLGLLCNLPITIGLLTNLNGDHLVEFDGSIEKYIDRKLLLENSSELFISNNKCRDIISPLRDNSYYYAMDEDILDEKCQFIGTALDKSLKIKYDFNNIKGEFISEYHMMSYFFENAVAASSIALLYGINEKSIIEALSVFKGIPIHMEYFGDYNGRKVIIDTAFLEEGMIKTFEYFSDERIVLFLDHFDTSSERNKKDVGKLCGKYADVIIASGYNEFKKTVEMSASYELLDGVENPNVIKVPAETIEEAAELSFKYSNPGDVILHMGPLTSAKREIVTKKIKEGIESGSQKYK
ncbi:UDP-N-acetylmuramoylalanine--D-glutamate ligase [Methanobrevibacter sp. OttesenSCG-928-K11]|nr:UDP-N-acetylmuramoylalanine--D-glutamate ligase [Methanobrevibacter sp. OttesenSCG-928-K11]MDL2271214.1 UDP-N-acetylmuramoylalanine--D-glutamate ligase [Methanobrevibacter sp. OttesenSCG-928-I08]